MFINLSSCLVAEDEDPLTCPHDGPDIDYDPTDDPNHPEYIPIYTQSLFRKRILRDAISVLKDIKGEEVLVSVLEAKVEEQ